MKLRLTRTMYFLIFSIVFLFACGILQPAGEAVITTSTPAVGSIPMVPTEAPFIPPPTAFEALPVPAPSSIYTFSVPGPMDPTALPTTTPLVKPLLKFLPIGYVVLLIRDGNLYFQDENNLPIKLTQVGEDASNFNLSDDDKKIFFSRVGNDNDIAINSDGSREHPIFIRVIDGKITIYEEGISKRILGFIPGTHQLFFGSYLCESPDFGSPCSTSIEMVNTDTGDIKKLADLGLAIQPNRIPRNIAVSPNGRMVAVGTMERMDILNMDGRIIRHNFLSYTPTTATVLFPSFFWLPDSSGLIVGLPNAVYKSQTRGDLPAHTLWRYKIAGNVATQIPLDPPPMLDTFEVSPDGNWILYGGLFDYDNAVYLGNLADGHVQTAGNALQAGFSWSPDSRYFIYTDTSSTFGAVDDPADLKSTCTLRQWIDGNHFACQGSSKDLPASDIKALMAVIRGDAILTFDLGFPFTSYVMIRPKR